MSFGNSSITTSIRVPHVPRGHASIDLGQYARQPNRYGVFAWWPEDAEDWIHPYDQTLAADYIPSDRVWQRFQGEAEYDLFCYGDVRFRGQARMWLPVEMEGYWIGDWVEVLSHHRLRRPFIAQITEVRWSRVQRRFEYGLRRNGTELRRRFAAETFRRCRALNWWQHDDWRGEQLREASSIRIEPLPDNSATLD